MPPSGIGDGRHGERSAWQTLATWFDGTPPRRLSRALASRRRRVRRRFNRRNKPVAALPSLFA
jgi:hypothetical protein